MERSAAWAAIDGQRHAVVHLLEDLSEQEWRQPSLCEGWTVRQVAARHEISGPIGALLLLLTGRPAALRQLSGPGVAGLRELFMPSPVP